MNTSRVVVAYLGLFVLVCAFIWFGVALYVANKKIEILLRLFPNSLGVKTLSALRYGGVWGKIMLIGGITSYVTFPFLYLKNGQLSRKDLQAIPTPLKRRLITMQWVLVSLVSLMFALYVIDESGLLY
ncbi:hypothetical protein NTD84_18035 [Pseudomonas sp. 14P_8.1_Bac3]|uniref:hypothetical protein n=1 Tax=Pseudomonas sp. 14P_8.1_Bac3 TaxID=2971621 RepID=UPI0021CA9DD7|nr:hypothetical protein [Pseudomonas sp. 14P_8.1_Bac3]MCU1761607.1 hypothetical protein [Pseudomonas sp. 14P_8.1_Bac3]